MNLSEPFVRRPIATVLLTIGLALAGQVHASSSRPRRRRCARRSKAR